MAPTCNTSYCFPGYFNGDISGENSESAFCWIIIIYAGIRFILSGMYYISRKKNEGMSSYARGMAVIIAVFSLLTFTTILLHEPIRQFAFIFIIFMEMFFTLLTTKKLCKVPIHRKHLVERVGLLSLILLGESVISLIASLSGIQWNIMNVTAAITGFVLICTIWWIYFDSFHVLEKAKRITNGFTLLYSHPIFCVGLIFLANIIRYSILNNIEAKDFNILAISGMTFFYLGKQTSYFVAFPVYRVNNIINSLICIFITICSTFLSRNEYALIGITAGMIFYAYSNFKWTLTKDASEYMDLD